MILLVLILLTGCAHQEQRIEEERCDSGPPAYLWIPCDLKPELDRMKQQAPKKRRARQRRTVDSANVPEVREER